MSITSIARSLSESAIIRGMRGLPFDKRRAISVPLETSNQLADADAYFLGCSFHALLRRLRLSDREALSKQEKMMLPWLSALRSTLRDMGVKNMDPLVRFPARGGLPGGEPDLVVHGGPQKLGVIEVKVVDRLPARPAHEHLLQVGAYAAHIARRADFCHPWVGVVYVSFRTAQLDLFVYHDARSMARKSRALLAQAA